MEQRGQVLTHRNLLIPGISPSYAGLEGVDGLEVVPARLVHSYHPVQMANQTFRERRVTTKSHTLATRAHTFSDGKVSRDTSVSPVHPNHTMERVGTRVDFFRLMMNPAFDKTLRTTSV